MPAISQVGGDQPMGAMLAVTVILRMSAYSVRKRLRELRIVSSSARSLRTWYRQRWDGPSDRWLSVPTRDCSAEFWRAGCWLSECIHTTPRNPLVFAGVVLTTLSLELLAKWIPARRAVG